MENKELYHEYSEFEYLEMSFIYDEYIINDDAELLEMEQLTLK